MDIPSLLIKNINVGQNLIAIRLAPDNTLGSILTWLKFKDTYFTRYISIHLLFTTATMHNIQCSSGAEPAEICTKEINRNLSTALPRLHNLIQSLDFVLLFSHHYHLFTVKN